MKTLQRMVLSVLPFIVYVSIAVAQNPDRTQPPKLGPAPAMKLPPIQHLKLSNGVPVILMERHELPLVHVELLIMSGAAMDPKEKLGRTSLTAAMMEEGAGTRNALELADAIDYLGAQISAFGGQHTSGLFLHTPLSKLDSALALFGDVALRPTFPSEELERNRIERLTTLLQWHDEPRSIASVAFGSTLFGQDHPYGKQLIGTEKSLRAMTVDDLREFHRTYYKSNNANLIVVGDVTANMIIPELEAMFGKWEKGEVGSPVFPKVNQVQKRQIFLVDKPGAAQSEIRIGRIGVARTTEDYFPLIVLNTILGGSFTSRLNQNLREQHGYTYGAGSVFDMRPQPGPFIASSSVQTDVTDKALKEFMNELTGILKPVPDAELSRAKNYVILGYPDNFETIGSVASQLAELVIYHLPDETFNDFAKNVRAVTKDDVRRVAKKYIDAQKIDIIIVGDRAKIEKGIQALNLGPITNLSIDDVLGVAPILGEGK